MKLFKNFKEASNEYRAVPLWAWNAKLEPRELRRQIRVMKAMGLGGFFMHARVGLDTSYLGKDWFKCVKACLDEAQKNGMNAWLYDEDKYPSGPAGGLVTRHDKYKEKKLHYEVLSPGQNSNGIGQTLAWFTGEINGDKLIKPKRLKNRPSAKKVIRFYWMLAPNNSWYNGFTYLDTMNGEAVQAFINTTHEAYRKHVGNAFGSCVPGIFSDEPSYTTMNMDKPDMLGWTIGLENIFKQKYGYDLLDHLPELFFDCGNSVSKARWHYHDLVTSLFIKAFARQIGQWCKKNNLLYTGHVLEEDSLGGQARNVGSAMRFYEYMQVPGIDLLTEHWNIFNTMKQCTSAARQFGQKRRLCETYGCTGWDFSFAGHKALGDMLYATGINLRCQHLAWYSMAGEGKRDYPASISYQSPWAHDYTCVEDYFARLGAAMTEGNEVRDLLFITPIESYWCMHAFHPYGNNEETPEAATLNADFLNASAKLLNINIDFDYGDEELMSRYASIKGKNLQVGKASYKAVLIPNVKTLRSSTLALLEKFIEAGGTVFYLGNAPAYVNAEKSQDAIALYKKCKCVTLDNLNEELTPLCRRISIQSNGTEAGTLLYRMAEDKDFCQVFICNMGMELNNAVRKAPAVSERTKCLPQAKITLKTAIKGNVYELNPMTGNITLVDYSYKKGVYSFSTSFVEWESRLFVITPKKQATSKKTQDADVQRLSLPTGPWKIHCSEANVLVLDQAKYAIGKGKLSKETQYVLSIDNELRDFLGIQKREEAMIQPYLRHNESQKPSTPVKLEYEFTIAELPAKTCYLAVELPQYYMISINGTKLEKDAGWWVDICTRKLAIPAGVLKKGLNKIVMECLYSEDMPGLEASFLLGDFGVDEADRMVKAPRQLAAGDWCKQGLPYYAGNITYKMKLNAKPEKKKVILSIGNWRGVALKVKINDAPAKILPWPPYELDITNALRADGNNTMAITVLGSRRNAFGPFYASDSTPYWCGSGVFQLFLHKNKNIVPAGLL